MIGKNLANSEMEKRKPKLMIKNHGQSKHIDIKYHFVREKVSEGSIELRYCTTENMLADMFTKGLSGPKFKKLRNLIGMLDISNIV